MVQIQPPLPRDVKYASPGVPGGIVAASIAVIATIFSFTEVGIALLITMYALLDPFGTAHNLTTDGAMMMILSKRADKLRIGEEDDNNTPVD